jgi:hypothetical protein
MATLLAEFNTYFDSGNADPVTDLVGYRQHAIWLSPAEVAQLIDELRAVLLPRLRNSPEPGRNQYLLSPVLFPIGGRPAPDPTTDIEQES